MRAPAAATSWSAFGGACARRSPDNRAASATISFLLISDLRGCRSYGAAAGEFRRAPAPPTLSPSFYDAPVNALPAGPRVGPYERVLWRNASMLLGSFDASPETEDFETAGAVGEWPAIAFSRTAAGIAQEKRPEFVSDGTVAVLHNPRHPYRRFRVDARGDHCEFVSVEPELLLGSN